MQSPITSKPVQLVVLAFVVLIFLCLAFIMGLKAGEHRSRHLCRWIEQHPGRSGFLPMRTMPLPNGVFGQVLSTSGTQVLIQGRDNFEQTVLITPFTIIRTEQGEASSTDIHPSMDINVLGKPTRNGQIEARLIRLLDVQR